MPVIRTPTIEVLLAKPDDVALTVMVMLNAIISEDIDATLQTSIEAVWRARR